MQRIPAAMFQTLQRQRAQQSERSSGRSEGSSEGSQEALGEPCAQTRQSSFPFPTDGPYSSPTPSPPTPSLDSETARYPRLSRAEVPRGGRGGAGRRAEFDNLGTEDRGSSEAAQQVRSVSGPRALGATSRGPAAETVSPQLVGRRAERDADVLTSDTIDFAKPEAERRLSRQRPINVEARPGLLRPGLPRQEPALTPTNSISDLQVQSTLPPSSDSSSSFGGISGSSQKSYASSFAYMVQDKRNDMRLFKKKSRPSQHLRKPTVLAKRPQQFRRSSSYYKPKVVEDSAALLAPASTPGVPGPSSGLKPPTPSLSPARPAVRHARSSPSQSTSETSPHLRATPVSTSRHAVAPLSGRDLDSSPPITPIRRQQTGSMASGSHSRDSSRSRPRLRPGPSSGSVIKRRYQPDTPPEEEPQAPYDSANRHGSHYFRTFGADTIYQTGEFRRNPSPRPPYQARQTTLSIAQSPASSRSPSPRPPSENIQVSARSHKRGSVFGMLRHPGGNHHIFHGHRNESEEIEPPTPAITVSSPQLAKSRRRSSVTSYFMQPPRMQQPSSATPSPATMGLSTNWEDVVAESQLTPPSRGTSEPMSPMSVPSTIRRARPKPTPVQEKQLEASRELPNEAINPAVSSEAVIGPQPQYKSPSGEESYNAPMSGLRTLSFPASEMKRVTTPPESKKRKGFKGFFFDMRSMPSDSTEPDPESPEVRASKRRGPILQTKSMQSLLHKLSLSKIQRKPSQILDDRREFEDPLAVTGFQQTPYSQRYGDARRAKMSQIRSYVEEALKEDDEDESLASPFVINVPDHLPNSPLCPLSPKHKSGGKAICPIHGRKRTVVGTALSKPAKVQRQGPTIVFESGPQESGNWTPELEDLTAER